MALQRDFAHRRLLLLEQDWRTSRILQPAGVENDRLSSDKHSNEERKSLLKCKSLASFGISRISLYMLFSPSINELYILDGLESDVLVKLKLCSEIMELARRVIKISAGD